MKRAICGAVRLLLFSILFLQVGRANATITVGIAPGNVTVSAGETVPFGAIVVTTGGETVTGYQWFTSTNSQGPFTLVGQASTLPLSNVQVTNSGYYFTKISYHIGAANGFLSSTQVNLTVYNQPRIVTQPISANREPGSNVTFSVVASGASPLTYQWRHDGVNFSDDARITGSSGTNLNIQNIALPDNGGYDLVVANGYGSATSHVAALNIAYIPPVITSATNALGKQGHAFNFTIGVTGTPPLTFGATNLPDGLSVNLTNGLISGIPSVYGNFDITLLTTNSGGQTTSTDLFLTLADDIPVIVSATSAIGKQGFLVTYAITATNDPAWFDAGPLPLGMNVDNTSGVISGIPLVSGVFPITILTTNAYGAASNTLTLTLASGAPLITSALTKSGKQGQTFTYTIKATNNPASYSTSPLPDGLTLNPVTGVISGLPLVYGTFAVTIGSVNMFGSDSQTLTINLATGAPTITSSLTKSGLEEGFFVYTITANNTPTSFWATGLPFGLTVNTNTGDIFGKPLYAGPYTVQLFAANAWGVGTATLHLNVNNKTIGGLAITDVRTNYYSPYLLEFRFALRDSEDPLTSHAVVASPTLMNVTAFEDDVPIGSETGVTLQRVSGQGAKVLKGYLVLDFTASVASLANGDANGNGISDAVEAEIAAAQDFIYQQPSDSQIGVYEFHRDDEAPQLVMSLTTDKARLASAIGGIWTNYVQGFPAGSRVWDALSAAITALGPTNADESHYVVFMSDGQDDSSTKTVANVIQAANTGGVQLYAVGFGADTDPVTLQNLTDSTFGRFYQAVDPASLSLSFAVIGKDLSSQYILRWATLKRSAATFTPSFQIEYQGFVAGSPPNPPPVISGTNFVVVTNNGVVDTNAILLYTTNYIISPYSPTVYAGNILGGFLRLVPNAQTNPTAVTVRAIYAPRYIRQLNLHYRANWPVTLGLNSTNTGEILAGWSLTQTNDGAGGAWALLSSPDTNDLSTSIPFAAFGDLLTFSFPDPIKGTNAFSSIVVDNTIYTNTAGTNFYGFQLTNSVLFTTAFTNPPPHGTPIPWLMLYGYTNNFDAAELFDPNGNGMPNWQDYIAGLNPTNANSTFNVQIAPAAAPPQIVFGTAIGRTYRIEWASNLSGPWTTLRDGITGTGANVTFNDLRNLGLARIMYYRVVVEGPFPPVSP
jgi:Ig-like domain-containing protein/von Willebrand factor type A domain-containing protein/putative Ig domain-containing protein